MIEQEVVRGLYLEPVAGSWVLPLYVDDIESRRVESKDLPAGVPVRNVDACNGKGADVQAEVIVKNFRPVYSRPGPASALAGPLYSRILPVLGRNFSRRCSGPEPRPLVAFPCAWRGSPRPQDRAEVEGGVHYRSSAGGC